MDGCFTFDSTKARHVPWLRSGLTGPSALHTAREASPEHAAPWKYR